MLCKSFLFFRCITDAHPLAKRLNSLLLQEKIPKDCIMFKYLDNVTEIALRNPSEKSNFTWDKDVLEFFQTIKYLGGERTYNFVRGPGFHNTGRGGNKAVDSMAMFNLGGPSLHAVRKCDAGYTTKSGVLRPLLNAFHSFSDNPLSNVSYLVDTANVKVIPVCLAADGTALKPGLEYDEYSKTIVGATHIIDLDYVKDNVDPNIVELKTNIVTEASVTFMTSLDNQISLPVAVHYLPKSQNGQQTSLMYENIIQVCQMCSKCISTKTNSDVISESDGCVSFCEECWKNQAVCSSCAELGHQSHLPQLRACNACVRGKQKCSKVAVCVLVMDCESKNKNAMQILKAESPYALNMLSPLPDVVHLGKSIKCSWANWFIIVGDERTNLVFLRTLRDHAESDIRKQLRKLLTLECVRNKDRMAVEPIVKLTRTSVQKCLSKISKVVHTIMPETYRFWKSNQRDMYPHPVALCVGPQGNLLVLNHGKDGHTKSGTLLKVRLHYPADVIVLKKHLECPCSVAYNNGVAYYIEAAGSDIHYVDLQKKVRLNISSLKSKEQVTKYLDIHNLSNAGTMTVLKKRLAAHIDSQAKQLTSCCVQLPDNQVKKITAIAAFSNNIAYADKRHASVVVCSLELDGVTVKAGELLRIQYPAHGDIQSIILQDKSIYLSMSSTNGGLFKCERNVDCSFLCILRNNTDKCQDIGGITINNDQIYFCDTGSRQVKVVDSDGQVMVIAGSGKKGSTDGTSISAAFMQPTGLCSEGKTLYVADAGGRVCIISGLEGTKELLKAIGKLYDCFGIHQKGQLVEMVSLSEVHNTVSDVRSIIEVHVQNAADTQGIQNIQSLNGPQGTISAATRKSVEMLEGGIAKLVDVIDTTNPEYSVESPTLLTTAVENLHAVSHFKHVTFTVLQYARDFASIMKESLKRSTKWAAKYYTHPKSYYPVPETNMPLCDITGLKKMEQRAMAKDDEEVMRGWAEPFRPLRQRTVRDETTKDKAGTLPPLLYTNPTNSAMETQSIQVLSDITDGVAALENVLDDSSDKMDDQHNQEAEKQEEQEFEQISEYETDSDDEISPDEDSVDLLEQQFVTKKHFTRSGRQIKAAVRLDL